MNIKKTVAGCLCVFIRQAGKAECLCGVGEQTADGRTPRFSAGDVRPSGVRIGFSSYLWVVRAFIRS